MKLEEVEITRGPRGLMRGSDGRSLAGIAGSNSTGACFSVVSDVCFQVLVSAVGRSPVQRSPTECGLSECECEASIMSGHWPIRSYRAMKK